MDRKLKSALNDAFAAPPPRRKAAFLKAHPRREMSAGEMMLTQAGYVRGWTWGGSVALFLLMLWMAAGMPEDSIWSASALTPLLALLAVAESGRSRRYHMEELELSCRMPLRAVLLARMAAIGVVHLVLLALASPVLALWGGTGPLRAGAYLLTPYLLTTSLGMDLSRRIRGQEGLLVCAAVAGLVCGAGLLVQRLRPELYLPATMPFWWVALTLTLLASVLEGFLLMGEARELQEI